MHCQAPNIDLQPNLRPRGRGSGQGHDKPPSLQRSTGPNLLLPELQPFAAVKATSCNRSIHRCRCPATKTCLWQAGNAVPQDLYEVLGLTEDADEASIKKAWHMYFFSARTFLSTAVWASVHLAPRSIESSPFSHQAAGRVLAIGLTKINVCAT